MNNNPRQRSCCYPHFTSCGRMNMAPQMLCTLILKVVRMLFHMTKRDLQKWGRILSRRDGPSCRGKPSVIWSCKKLARVSRAEKAKERLKQRVKGVLWIVLEKKTREQSPLEPQSVSSSAIDLGVSLWDQFQLQTFRTASWKFVWVGGDCGGVMGHT